MHWEDWVESILYETMGGKQGELERKHWEGQAI